MRFNVKPVTKSGADILIKAIFDLAKAIRSARYKKYPVLININTERTNGSVKIIAANPVITMRLTKL